MMISQPTIIITTVLAGMTCIIWKKYFLLPFIIATCFVPADQRIVLMDLDFTPLRILIVVGFLRIIFRGEQLSFKLNRFDKLVLAWTICGAIIYVLQWSDMRAMIYKCGVLFDVIGFYWLFRVNINDLNDVGSLVKVFAICSVILAFFVGIEWATGRNPFEVLGRVTTRVRQGRFRCQASFPHSIMLGLFWATLVPVFICGIKYLKHLKLLSWSALITSSFMVISSASSTPWLTLVAVLCLLSFFRFRKYGCYATWIGIGALVILHIVMKAPVWHLFARINVVGGSTGYHRYNLIDNAISHFGEWALLGTRSTAHWGYMTEDVTNQYIYEAVMGGLLSLVLFIVLLATAVKIVGSYSLRKLQSDQQWFVWGLCVSLLGHCISFLGVTYFGQIQMLLYFELAVVGVICQMSTSFVYLPRSDTRK